MNSVNDRNDEESPGDKCFVFGANGNSCGAKASSAGNEPVTPLSDEEEFSTPIGESVFGSEFTKEHSDGFIGKNPFASMEDFGGQNGIDKNTAESNTCSDTYRKSGCVQNTDGVTIDDCELNLPAEMKKLNISDTSVNGGNGNEEARESNNAPAFIFGSSGKVDAAFKVAATSGPWSFSSSGLNENNAADKRATCPSETTNVNNFAGTTFATRTSFDDFRVPVWDPSVLKNSLFPEVSRDPVQARRSFLSKDKRSKKVKDKVKRHEVNQCNDQASEGIESQEKLSSPGYGSPMDFSPYEGEKASNQFPTETPLTSIDPSHSREDVNSRSSNDFKVVFTAEDHGSSYSPAFSFSASTSQGQLPNKKLQAVKKYRRKVDNIFPKISRNATMRNSQENQPVNTGQAKQESGSTSSLPNVCEVWRLRYHILTQELQRLRFFNTYFLGIKRTIVL